jgi:hypothetical protein
MILTVDETLIRDLGQKGTDCSDWLTEGVMNPKSSVCCFFTPQLYWTLHFDEGALKEVDLYQRYTFFKNLGPASKF